MGYSPDKLNKLAEKVGILPSFIDRTTNITYHADDQSKQAILKSLGFLAETDADIDASFLKLKKEEYAEKKSGKWLHLITFLLFFLTFYVFYNIK